MRELTSHKVNGLNEALKILVTDEPGSGGANHEYQIFLRIDPEDRTGLSDSKIVISFQNGPILEEGVNGISGEALLAIVEDRLKCFQEGPYKSRENALALTRERMARGVEGTHQK